MTLANGQTAPRTDVEIVARFAGGYDDGRVFLRMAPDEPGGRIFYLNSLASPFVRALFLVAPGGNRAFGASMLAANSDKYRPAGWGTYLFQWPTGPLEVQGEIKPEDLAAIFPPSQQLRLPIPEHTPSPLGAAFLTSPAAVAAHAATSVSIAPMSEAPAGSFISLICDPAGPFDPLEFALPPSATSAPLAYLQAGRSTRAQLTYHRFLYETVVDGVPVRYYEAERVVQTFTAPRTPANLNVFAFNASSRRVTRGEKVEVELVTVVASPTLLDDAGQPQGVLPAGGATYRLFLDGTLVREQAESLVIIDTDQAPNRPRYRIEVVAAGETTVAAEFTLEVVGAAPGREIRFVRHPWPDADLAEDAEVELVLVADAVGPNGERFDSATFAGQRVLYYRWYRNGVPTEHVGSRVFFPTITPENEGVWTVYAAAGGSYAFSQPFEVRRGAGVPAASLRLVNVSARLRSGTGDAVAIVGAATTGDATLLARHVGAGMIPFGVSAVVPDPTLALVQNGRLIAHNDDWSAGPAHLSALFDTVGAFALANRDAALTAPVAQGLVTAVLDPKGPAAGESLAEFYVVEGAPVRNLSVRGHLSPDHDHAILGFVLAGSGARTYLIRVVGPGLGEVGLSSSLNPEIELFAGSVAFARNADWELSQDAQTIQDALQRLGGLPLAPGQGEAAILVSLSAGAYTASVRAEAASQGFYLAEIWEVE